ncbi:MAG: GNAT family N-acetyltransferase [Candidatus Kariarchaeaceae archaeon]|jgi:RimJ/RimL family protein N-acetyltransferase
MLFGQNIYLRGLELTDVTELMKHWNNAEVKKFLISSVPHSIQEEVEWVKHTWKLRKDGKSFIFAIIYKETDLYIGNIEIEIISQISRRGAIGIVIFNQDYWNKGFGTESIQILLNFAFNILNLNSVELEVFAYNQRAKQCYKKCGFKQMGIRREAVFMEGEYFDSLLLDITVNEWKGIKD